MQLARVDEVGSCDYKCSVCLYGSSRLKTSAIIISAFSSYSLFCDMCLCVCGICIYVVFACSHVRVHPCWYLKVKGWCWLFFLNIFLALFLETGFLNGLSAGSSLFCLERTACKCQRSSCLCPSILGLCIHIPCSTFLLWVLGIHTQVLMLV